jgi:hypothetical protein
MNQAIINLLIMLCPIWIMLAYLIIEEIFDGL